jgi:hypothetical protein
MASAGGLVGRPCLMRHGFKIRDIWGAMMAIDDG